MEGVRRSSSGCSGSNVFVACLNKIAHPSGWSRICFITSHGEAHTETPRAPAPEEESGIISCPKRLAPRAMWPVPTHAQKDSLKKDSCPKKSALNETSMVQETRTASLETFLFVASELARITWSPRTPTEALGNSISMTTKSNFGLGSSPHVLAASFLSSSSCFCVFASSSCCLASSSNFLFLRHRRCPSCESGHLLS